MSKKKLTPLIVIPAIVFVFVWYVSTRSGVEEPLESASAEAANEPRDLPAMESDLPNEEIAPDAGALLDDPAFQDPSHEPLVSIVGRDKVLTGPIPFLGAMVSADGKYLVATGDGYEGLWVANADGTGLKQISDGYSAGWRPVTTEAGELIFRTREFDEDGNLLFTMHLYDFETGELKTIYEGFNEDLYPAWLTRDQDYVLMLKDGDIMPYPLRETEDTVPLSERDEGIAYSDGGQVYFQHFGMKESMVISTDDQATGGESASPTGKHIAYLSGNANSGFIVDMETGNEVAIGEASNFSWSPDGRFLLYDVTRDDGHDILDSDIFIVDPTGKTRQRLTFDPDYAFFGPNWSPNGDYFTATDIFTGEVHRFDVEIPEEESP
ncbi:MAG TPA: hypothetical protein VK041_00805 [Opitutales bacterium]|nr:hypothetical protein [Opitutales bacterium]